MPKRTLQAPIQIAELPAAHQALHERVQALYRRATESGQDNQMLSEAFGELEFALDELRAHAREQHEQQERWLNERAELEAEIQRCRELFDQVPLAYITTRLDGSIQQANQAAVALLGTEERLLFGRPLAFFIPQGQRRSFREELARLHDISQPCRWEAILQPWQGGSFMIEFIVSLVRGRSGMPRGLRWLIDERSQHMQRKAHQDGHGALLERAVGID